MTDIIPEQALGNNNQPWRRWVESSIRAVRQQISTVTRDMTNSFSAISSSMRLLSEQVRSMPLPAGFYVRRQGFGLNGGTIYLDQVIPIPAGKTKVVLTAIGNVYVLDRTSGGLAVAQASIEASGSGFNWSTPFVYASKDSGASVVANIITPALGFQQENLIPGGSFLVSMAISASSPPAFPVDATNFGTLTVTAIFFD